MKKFICFLLAVVMMLGMVTVAGASGYNRTEEKTADKLNVLNLFTGTDKGYDLHATPTRIQALVMTLRLQGLEDEALAYTGKASPFTDLTWGKKYVHYAYNVGLTKGSSDTTFSPEKNMAPSDYVTFLLRALGYSEAKKDFKWGTQLELAYEIGLIDEAAKDALYKAKMNRGDMVELSFAALTCKMKDSEQTLAEKLVKQGTFTEEEALSVGAIGNGQVAYAYKQDNDFTVSCEKVKVSTSEGPVSAQVLRVNTSNPKVEVKSALVDNTLGSTAPFKDIVANSGGALAVFNANFFASYSEFKAPIGHIMVDGDFLYGSSGLSALGITKYGELRTGRPAVFVRMTSESKRSWALYSINEQVQSDAVSTLYTPAFGDSVLFKVEGYALTITDGKFASYSLVPAGTEVAIPKDGSIVFMGKSYVSTAWFYEPVMGDAVTIEPYLKDVDVEGFTLDDVVSIISGAPRLVQDGEIVTRLESTFSEARFTTLSTCRTAVGIDKDGYLVLVSVTSATIQQMREFMLSLGCVDAINLDGGGSCAMYYDGTYYATPGRELTATIQIFVNG